MRIDENPLLVAITAITAVLGVLNAFSVTLGLPPFWSDVVVVVAALYTLLHWWVSMIGSRKQAAGIVHPPSRRRVPFGSLLVSLLIAALIVWNAAPLAAHVTENGWRLCASFPHSCETSPCLRLYDARHRPIDRQCFSFDDATAFKNLAAPHWWTYRPAYAALDCAGTVRREVALPAVVFDRSCAPILELP
jgi:hypothetical protein